MMLKFFSLFRGDKITKTVLLKTNCKICAINEKLDLFSKGQATEVLLWKSHYAACYSTVKIKDFERKAACRLLINTVKHCKSKLIKVKKYTGFKKKKNLKLKLLHKDFFFKYCPKLYSNKIQN